MNQENQAFAENQPIKKKKIYQKWWFWLVIVVVAVIIIAAASSGQPSDLIDLPEDEYRSQCQVYTYDQIARNPDDYEKKLAKFTGEVVQVLREGKEIQMRVDVTRTEYGFYEDTVYVFYTAVDNANILEGDIITMYGELRGMQEYEAIFGNTVSIPRIYVKYIDVQK